jgi:hypothetical protein
MRHEGLGNLRVLVVQARYPAWEAAALARVLRPDVPPWVWERTLASTAQNQLRGGKELCPQHDTWNQRAATPFAPRRIGSFFLGALTRPKQDRKWLK